MGQDKPSGTGSSHRMARLRVARLSASSESPAVQGSETGTTRPENAPLLDSLNLREAEEKPTISMATPAAGAGKPSSTPEIEERPTISIATPDSVAGKVPGTDEIEERPTISMATPEGVAGKPSSREEIDEKPTRFIATPGPGVRRALTTGAEAMTGMEEKPTYLLPAVTKTPIPRRPPTTDLPPAAMVEQLQTLQMPSVAATPGPSTSGKSPIPTLPPLEDVASQQTLQMPQISGATAAPAQPPMKKGFAGTIQRLVNHALTRLQEPQPEGLVTRGLRVVRLETTLGLFPLFTLLNAVGLLLISISYYLSDYGSSALEFAFLAGLLLLFVPNVLRLLSPTPLRFERIYLLCGLALAFYLVAFMTSPLQITSFDGFLHWVTADGILRTRHLFSENSLLPVSPYYPGLEMMTNAISSLTGLNTFYASIPLIVVARIILVVSLFLFYEQITGSSRMAGIATVIYMINPHFIFFDTIYNYETLALPLALFAFYLLARYEHVGGEHRQVIFASWVVLMAITVTHHMTDIVTDSLLLLWAVVSFFASTRRRTRIHLLTLAIFGFVLAAAYAFLVDGNPVWSYLSSYFNIAFVELGKIITGTGSSRALFSSTGAAPAPIWDRVLMLGSVAIVAFALPFGLLTLWRVHRRNALPLVLGIFALGYPVAQAFRFTPLGSEISDRSAAFLFVAVAYVLTILITHFWPTRRLTKRTMALVTCALSVVLMGGVILTAGAGFTGMPGPYVVGADGRSVEPEGINAALWAYSQLGPGQRVGTDRTNQLLMSTYGEQRVITELYDSLDVSPLFYSEQFTESDSGLLREGKIHYLVVDMRLSTALPALGFYFVSDEPEMKTLTTPISSEALNKFTTVPQINRLFDSGNIVIYDTGAFLNGPGS